MSVLVAIDIGVETGWALSRADGRVKHGTWRLHLKDGSGGRLLQLADRLTETHQAHALDGVVYEQPFMGRNATAVRVLFHFEAMILAWARRAELPCLGFTPREIKQSLAGGRATKTKMIEMVGFLGYQPANDHEADAIALLRLAMTGARPAEQRRKPPARERREDDLLSCLVSGRKRSGRGKNTRPAASKPEQANGATT